MMNSRYSTSAPQFATICHNLPQLAEFLSVPELWHNCGATICHNIIVAPQFATTWNCGIQKLDKLKMLQPGTRTDDHWSYNFEHLPLHHHTIIMMSILSLTIPLRMLPIFGF